MEIKEYTQDKLDGYKEIQQWRKRGKDFLIEINHHVPYADNNEWNVYAYIYPNHNLFNNKTLGEDMFNAGGLPFHWGASYCKWHRDTKGDVTAKQYGSDYNHLGDDYEKVSRLKDMHGLICDAERLFNYLTAENGD